MNMGKTKDENGDGGKTENLTREVPANDVNVLIAQAIQMLAQNQPKHVITQDSPEYQDRMRAEGFYDEFPKPVYQNGRECEPRGLSAETRERAANLRPGTYVSGKVTVEPSPNGGVHIKYRSKTVEERMTQPWKSFDELVDLIWSEMHVTTAA